MPDPVELPKNLRAKGWKVKIYNNERLEPPHITVICRERVWRISLRDCEFLIPPGGRWSEIDNDLRAIIAAQWETLCAAWDRLHPTKPVRSKEGEADG